MMLYTVLGQNKMKHSKSDIVKKTSIAKEKENQLTKIVDLLEELNHSTTSIKKSLNKLAAEKDDSDWLPKVYI